MSLISTAGMTSLEELTNSQQVTGPPFLHLPGEIRNRIYTLLLVEDKPMQVVLREEDSQFRPGLWQPSSHHLRYNLPHIQRSKTCKHDLAITTTCRQIREESLSLFLSNNTFILKFCDHVPTTMDLRLWRTFTQTRALHLRGWLSYLGEYKRHLNHVEVDLGPYKNNPDQAFLIDSMKDIKAAFPSTPYLAISAHITVASLQTVGRPAVPTLRLTTCAKSLEKALERLKKDVQRIRNWITSRHEGNPGANGCYALGWKHDSVRELARVTERVEKFLGALDADPTWMWSEGPCAGGRVSQSRQD